MRLHTRIDERTAGFLALGLTKVGAPRGRGLHVRHRRRQPAPAVLEAAHAGVPLVVVTADRPARLRGTGANQTTDQAASSARSSPTLDVSTAAATRCRLRRRTGTGAAAPQRPARRAAAARRPLGRRTSRRRVAAARCGPASRRDRSRPAHARWWSPATTRARRRGCCRAGRLAAARRAHQRLPHRHQRDPHLSAAARRRARRTVERVVVFGHPTLSRPVTRLLGARGRRGRLGAPGGVWPERPFPVADELRPRPSATRPTTRVARGAGATPTVRSAGSSTRCWRPSPTSRRTRWQAPSAARCRPRGCWSSAPPARSATST